VGTCELGRGVGVLVCGCTVGDLVVMGACVTGDSVVGLDDGLPESVGGVTLGLKANVHPPHFLGWSAVMYAVVFCHCDDRTADTRPGDMIRPPGTVYVHGGSA